MKLLRKLVFVTASLLFLLLILAFPFGPLFPWSPLKQGYQTISYARGDVFVTKAQPVEADFTSLDQLMNEAESFHQLRYSRRLKVIGCKDWGTCERGLMWMNIHSMGGITLAGDVIYITPKLKEKNFSTAQFLRHELSHALLCQNTTLLNGYKLKELPWFFEGLAVSFGRQQDYLKRAEWLTKTQTDGLAQYLDPAQRPAEWNARFAYPTQRYFIEWLKATYGNELFQQFLTRHIAAPDGWRATFTAVYPMAFGEAVQHYEQAVRTGAWLPTE
jgi:hypothetical protein